MAGQHSSHFDGANTGSDETDYGAMMQRHAERSLDATAKALSQRHSTQATDVGAGDLEKEQRLQEVQMQLHRHHSGAATLSTIEVMRLEGLAEALATSLVSGEVQNTTRTPEIGQEAIEDALRDRYPSLDEDLAFAGQYLPEETSNELNALLEGDDDGVKATTVGLLNQMRANEGRGFTTERGGLSETDAARVVEEFGDDIGGQVVTLSAAVAAGHASVSDAIKLASKSPALLQALVTGTRKGLFQLMV